ncbi:MAG: hypothetical protein EBT12_15755 [Marivivens sp.]|nr:hypothetical protein [Marivivens sp.]
MAFVSTLGASNANSFLSVARATTLLGELPSSVGITAWLALTDTQKEQTLVAATMTINPLKWKGRVIDETQSLAWPRLIKVDGRQLSTEELPIDFEIAVAYMAAFLGDGGGYTAVAENDGGASLRETEQYKEVNLGDGALQVKFKEENIPQTGVDYIPPFAMDILYRYMIDPSFHQPYLSRTSTARVDPYYGGGAFRPRRIRFANGQVFPVYGGWASNPL